MIDLKKKNQCCSYCMRHYYSQTNLSIIFIFKLFNFIFKKLNMFKTPKFKGVNSYRLAGDQGKNLPILEHPLQFS